MNVCKDVQIRLIVHLTVYEARWLSNFLQGKLELEAAKDDELRKDLLEALQDALDFPENQ